MSPSVSLCHRPCNCSHRRRWPPTQATVTLALTPPSYRRRHRFIQPLETTDPTPQCAPSPLPLPGAATNLSGHHQCTQITTDRPPTTTAQPRPAPPSPNKPLLRPTPPPPAIQSPPHANSDHPNQPKSTPPSPTFDSPNHPRPPANEP
ncbi:unnamed protein product [Cuscuta europaea]|uniref:Uncharacterized protein n=1 Tax=Cuscuta europaea TaxID=41803 RepID=A0A9P0YYW0_CUSEU|nr:unnamed protein product [Cuscuta europaea]